MGEERNQRTDNVDRQSSNNDRFATNTIRKGTVDKLRQAVRDQVARHHSLQRCW